jgi:hypothetical protein
MKSGDPSKKVFLALVSIGGLGFAFFFGLHSGGARNGVYWAFRDVEAYLTQSVGTVAWESRTMLGIRPDHYLQDAKHDGTGVVADKMGDDGALILISGFFNNETALRLMRRDGTDVAYWSVPFSRIFPNPDHMHLPPETDWNIDLHGALALPDGSVIFNFEYGGLAKLDRCGRVIWTLRRQTHHAVELDDDGNLWVPSRRHVGEDQESEFPPFPVPYDEDFILKVSPDGKILEQVSVPRLLYDNGFEPLLTATGMQSDFRKTLAWDEEIVHLNKIEPLLSEIAPSFPEFTPGDLALSLRTYNLVLVVDPHTWRVKWWQVGPWLRQHDPEFAPDGKILVFNNNEFTMTDKTEADARKRGELHGANVMEMDPRTRKSRIVFGHRPGQELKSQVRGKIDLTPNGGLLITEFEGGRVLEVDAQGDIVWSFINRYDKDHVAELTEARLYPKGYFTVTDWGCPSAPQVAHQDKD